MTEFTERMLLNLQYIWVYGNMALMLPVPEK